MPGNNSPRKNNNQAFWRASPLLSSVTIKGREGDKPFLILVQQMKIRHVDFAFRSKRIT